MRNLILVTLLLACGTAQASEWVSIGRSNDRAQETFIDVSSVRVVGAIRRAWFKVAIAPQTQRGEGPDANKWWSYTMEREAINCAEETERSEAATIYFSDGTSSPLPAESYPKPWHPITPDSMDHVRLRFICAWSKR